MEARNKTERTDGREEEGKKKERQYRKMEQSRRTRTANERTKEAKETERRVIRMAYLTDLIRDFKIPARVYNVVVKL